MVMKMNQNNTKYFLDRDLENDLFAYNHFQFNFRRYAIKVKCSNQCALHSSGVLMCSTIVLRVFLHLPLLPKHIGAKISLSSSVTDLRL